MSLPARYGARRRGFSVIELLIAVVLVAILATGASVSMVGASANIKRTAEAEKIVATLRWLRQCAISRGSRWQTGYGMYFWNNRRSSTCVQYSVYTGVDPRRADNPANTINETFQGSTPNAPNTIGPPQETEGTSSNMYGQDYALLSPSIPASAVTNGYEIVFQTDVPGVTDLPPVSYPSFPGTTLGYNVDRIVFWPPGYPAPVRPGNPWPNEYGVTLPRRGAVTFNRIYIRHPQDKGAQYSGGDQIDAGQLPARIHIHPGTGAVRLMESYEP